ncbi:rhodanese-like domain-containing protein [Methylogaea oryzae]|uniref:Rhodanese-like domain-containing protein n=1 Tax=Methylogaea oryzae TaxID=1295382 RepID=A0A8D5AKA6_9GAMM|nr:rhodanese-like domain-containing protein [Methylogaea oryzae]BBL70921.1 rhodanese-like domain-containing protein [Methylogaea oryzae]
MRQLSPVELKAFCEQAETPPLLLDVREPHEFAYCRLEGSLHIPMNQVPARLNELDPQRDIVVICHHGVRSLQVARYLEAQGYNRVINLEGGVDAWAMDVDADLPRY